MKYLVIIFFLCLYLPDLSAQEKHFVFIQSENNQPFYLFLNGKLFSSTATGYLIVPKLDNGNYNFSIGFAKNAFPEQSFQCVIDNKDLGFDLKNFGEKGWGLFNLQSMDVTMGESGNTDNVRKALSEKDTVKVDTEPVITFNRKKEEAPTKQEVPKSSPDTASNPSIAINEKQTGNEAKIGASAVESNEKNDNDDSIASHNNDNSVTSGEDLKKISESTLDDGLHLAYLDGNDKNGDTVNIIIPSEKTSGGAESNNTSASNDEVNINDTLSTPAENVTATNDSLKFLDITTGKGQKDVKEGTMSNENNVAVVTNSKCKEIATEDDYTRLRRKMAGETTDDKMINVARKAYRDRCFTTSQIKRLSTLFLSDEGRYNFFNASYNSVSDVAEYSTLQSEFIDPSIADRFKAMLK